MKKITPAIFTFVCMVLLLVSCSKGDYNSGSGLKGPNPYYEPPPGETVGGSFKAKVNGSDFVANAAIAIKSLGTISISGTKATSSTDASIIALYVNGETTGEYTIGANATGSYKPVGTPTPAIAQSGKVNITEVTDTKVKGTFELHASGLDIIDGTFDVDLTTTP